MRKDLKAKLSKIESKTNNHSKQFVLACEGIISNPKYLEGKNISELSENDYLIINILRA